MVGVEDKYHQGAVKDAVWGEETEVVAYKLNGEAKAVDDEVADGASLEASVYGDGAFSAEVTPSSMFVAAEPVVYVKGGKISGVSVTSTSLSKMFNGTVAEAEAAEESALLPVTADTGYSKSNKVSAIRYTLPASKLGETLEFAGFSSSKSTWGKKTLTIKALTTKAANCTLSVMKNDVCDTDLCDAPVVGVDANADGVVSLNEVMGAAYKKYLNGNADAAEGTDVFAEIWGADATLFSSINRAKFAAVSGSAEIANGDDIVIRDTKATQVVIIHAPSISKTYGDAAFSVKSGSAKTALTFKSSNTAVAKVDANGKVTIVAPGTANITISAVETDVYKSASNTIKLTVAKKAQKLAVSKAKKSAKRGKSTSAIAVSGAKSTKSFKKVSGSKFLTVNKTTGKIKISKKAKKGKTYSIKVKVSAPANKYYLSDAKTVTIKVKVK